MGLFNDAERVFLMWPAAALLVLGCARKDECVVPLSELGCDPGEDCYTFESMSAPRDTGESVGCGASDECDMDVCYWVSGGALVNMTYYYDPQDGSLQAALFETDVPLECRDAPDDRSYIFYGPADFICWAGFHLERWKPG